MVKADNIQWQGRFTIGVHIDNTTTNAVILHGKILNAKAKRPIIK